MLLHVVAVVDAVGSMLLMIMDVADNGCQPLLLMMDVVVVDDDDDDGC